jgi:hypothetical protein
MAGSNCIDLLASLKGVQPNLAVSAVIAAQVEGSSFPDSRSKQTARSLISEIYFDFVIWKFCQKSWFSTIQVRFTIF